VDGTYGQAAFNKPHGLAFDTHREWLYVADTQNHAIRAIDISDASPRVRTLLAPDAQQGVEQLRLVGAVGPLALPWDVALGPPWDDALYVAVAGSHQIWRIDPETAAYTIVSGTGAEHNQNGLRGNSTAWAQPSGLALNTCGTWPVKFKYMCGASPYATLACRS
jgi:DNA-binding beta-propeller fold protein YncE